MATIGMAEGFLRSGFAHCCGSQNHDPTRESSGDFCWATPRFQQILITMKILITGRRGLLARALIAQRPAGVEVSLLGRELLDLTELGTISSSLEKERPEAVINTAAYNLVDRCEIERDLSWAVNSTGPGELAAQCASRGIALIHYGSDYVFNGEKGIPYLENDLPSPLNHYGTGKLAGEQAVLAASPKHLVLRTSWLFGSNPEIPKTFVHTIAKLAKTQLQIKAAQDQFSVPTSADDLARWTYLLVQKKATGLLHAVNDEPVSRHDWTVAILEELRRAGLRILTNAVIPVPGATFNSAINRPDYSVLNNTAMARLLGEKPGSWRVALGNLIRTHAAEFGI